MASSPTRFSSRTATYLAAEAGKGALGLPTPSGRYATGYPGGDFSYFSSRSRVKSLIADHRRARLIEAMAEADIDMLLVYGNAWQVDYLRYATDFGILEGQALALVRNDGHITLYLDNPLEVDRAELDCSGVDV